MSKYSLDSLENSMEADSLEECFSADDDDDTCNLGSIDVTVKFDKNALFHLNPMPPTKRSHQSGRDFGRRGNPPAGCFVDGAPGDSSIASYTWIARGASGGSMISASKKGFSRQQQGQQWECHATKSWLRARKSNDAELAAAGRGGEADVDRSRSRRPHCPRARASSGPTTEQLPSPSSPRNVRENLRRGSSDKMTNEKKLGNVLAPPLCSRGPPSSYSELYRRRLNTSSVQLRIRSPEGSTLSIYGDSQLEDLSLEDEGHNSLPVTSRDDNSELSFYRCLMEAQTDHDAAITVRSCESQASRRVFPIGEQPKGPAYRPYTIEEYRSLSVPKPDRSLGPDKDELLTKREWLMRRRSYGDSVSARNRERILQRARGLKSRRAIAQKCFLPPLKDRDAVAAASKDRENSRIPETNDTTPAEGPPKRPVASSPAKKTGPEVSRKGAGSSSAANSSLTLRAILDDPYLNTLQQRHLRERELADRLMRQALNP